MGYAAVWIVVGIIAFFLIVALIIGIFVWRSKNKEQDETDHAPLFGTKDTLRIITGRHAGESYEILEVEDENRIKGQPVTLRVKVKQKTGNRRIEERIVDYNTLQLENKRTSFGNPNSPRVWTANEVENNEETKNHPGHRFDTGSHQGIRKETTAAERDYYKRQAELLREGQEGNIIRIIDTFIHGQNKSGNTPSGRPPDVGGK